MCVHTPPVRSIILQQCFLFTLCILSKTISFIAFPIVPIYSPVFTSEYTLCMTSGALVSDTILCLVCICTISDGVIQLGCGGSTFSAGDCVCV